MKTLNELIEEARKAKKLPDIRMTKQEWDSCRYNKLVFNGCHWISYGSFRDTDWLRVLVDME